ncbi:MAG: hypothetical protein ACI8PP_001672 [Candidatus Pseudothioglobus sp.]|jgi:hypothetical protein
MGAEYSSVSQRYASEPLGNSSSEASALPAFTSAVCLVTRDADIGGLAGDEYSIRLD